MNMRHLVIAECGCGFHQVAPTFQNVFPLEIVEEYIWAPRDGDIVVVRTRRELADCRRLLPSNLVLAHKALNGQGRQLRDVRSWFNDYPQSLVLDELSRRELSHAAEAGWEDALSILKRGGALDTLVALCDLPFSLGRKAARYVSDLLADERGSS